MGKLKVTTSIMAIAFVTLMATSCKDAKKEHSTTDGHHSEMGSGENHHDEGMDMPHDGSLESKSMMGDGQKSSKSDMLVANYLELKDALVEDNQNAASKAGGKMVMAFNNFDISSYASKQQEELKDIIEDGKEHAEHIAESPIEHQREHFDVLSIDLIDLIAITGTEKTLYQDFCPMYNNNKGAQWLSATKEIKNPYYGSKMMTCGSVQKQIN
ncbi:DUF3347 domain-containing protein [Arenibacter sp. N53]|jgi:hypothetical protein|uniref:DUF3347 domain-containing protein n=1 Tax=Arenibacter TaxID=178469 RepID=UPI0008532355|nr:MULTISPECIES: DUF3347 domain-containing protein [Arenibacter]MCM4151964.1 DUF3347 domain-containing protein [Arenibacter sp. N53]GBF20575.1 hypothetical protein C21_02748 [Arenibacter sp. NBRC 103722]